MWVVDRAARAADAIPAPGSRLPAPGSRLPAPGSRLPAPGSRLPAPGSRLPAPGSRLPAPGSRLPILSPTASRDPRTATTVIASIPWTQPRMRYPGRAAGSAAPAFRGGVRANTRRTMTDVLCYVCMLSDCYSMLSVFVWAELPAGWKRCGCVPARGVAARAAPPGGAETGGFLIGPACPGDALHRPSDPCRTNACPLTATPHGAVGWTGDTEGATKSCRSRRRRTLRDGGGPNAIAPGAGAGRYAVIRYVEPGRRSRARRRRQRALSCRRADNAHRSCLRRVRIRGGLSGLVSPRPPN